MVYSCAHFTKPHDDIARDQRDKLDMICRKLRLKPDETFLDIGCGWGALITHAAQNYGVRAHGVTLAEEQFAFAKEKVTRLGLQEHGERKPQTFEQLAVHSVDRLEFFRRERPALLDAPHREFDQAVGDDVGDVLEIDHRR